MKKLIKISDTHYIVVDDSEIKENDLFWIIGGHSVNFGIRTCYWINKSQPCWSEKNQNWTTEVSDNLYIDKLEDNGWGFVERNRALKITHSTQPLDNSIILSGAWTYPYIPLKLSEVEEAINGYNVEKMIPTKFCIPHKHYISKDDKICYDTGFKDGFKAHQELAKDKLFTIEDIKKAFNAGYDLHTWEELNIPNDERDYHNEHDYIQSLLPKTEWDIKFDEQGKIKLL